MHNAHIHLSPPYNIYVMIYIQFVYMFYIMLIWEGEDDSPKWLSGPTERGRWLWRLLEGYHA